MKELLTPNPVNLSKLVLLMYYDIRHLSILFINNYRNTPVCVEKTIG